MTALRSGAGSRRRSGPVTALRSGGAGSRSRRSGPARLLNRGSRVTMWLGLLIGLAVYTAFGLLPAAGNLLVSFTNYSGIVGSTTSFTGLSNYTALLTSERPGFVASVAATVVFVTGVTVLQNGFALLIAHRLVGDGKVEAVLRVLVFLPIVLGVTIVGLIWILIFDPSGGPAASLFGALGVHSAFFGSSTAALPLVIGVQVWQNTGFSTLVFIGGLKAINPEIYEAASIDGVGRWRRLRKITFPLLAPSVTVNVLLAVVGAFTTYNLIYVLTDGLYNTNTLGMLAFTSAFGTSANLGLGAAVSIVLFAMTLVVAVPLMIWLRRRQHRLLA